MIGITPLTIPLALVAAGPRPERTYAIVCCGRCGNASGSPKARVCTDVDCGLGNRFAHVKDYAA